MNLSVSIEVNIPAHVDKQSIIKVGEAAYPYNVPGDMEVHEAIQWAFTTAQGVTDLANLGVQWVAAHQ